MDKNDFVFLINKANEAMLNAYQIKSGVTVGAALLTNEYEIFLGVNVEPYSHQLAICAERSAIVSAVSAGKLSADTPAKTIKAIAVTSNIKNIIYPCGNCLQLISDFSNEDTKIVCANINKADFEVYSIEELFPQFNREDITPLKLTNTEIMKYESMFHEANRTINNAFSYTKEKTSAVLLTTNNKSYASVGVDSIAFGSSCCAEEGVILSALTDGEISPENPIKILLITSDKNDEIPLINGNSLQLISEFANSETIIICANASKKYKAYKFGQLLPVFEKLNKDLAEIIMR